MSEQVHEVAAAQCSSGTDRDGGNQTVNQSAHRLSFPAAATEQGSRFLEVRRIRG